MQNSELNKKECIVCADSIPAHAIKCRTCQSFQDFRRHLDVGNVSIALLIALFSVTALAVDSGSRAYNFIVEKRNTISVQAKVLDINPNSITFLYSNTGPDRVFISHSASCRVPVVRENVSLYTTENMEARYPAPNEIEFVQLLVFYEKGSAGMFLDAGEAITANVKLGQMRPEEGLPFNDAVPVVPAYCFTGFLSSTNEEDGLFIRLNPIQAASVGAAVANLDVEARQKTSD